MPARFRKFAAASLLSEVEIQAANTVGTARIQDTVPANMGVTGIGIPTVRTASRPWIQTSVQKNLNMATT